MKKNNLLHKTTLLILIFISFSFSPKKEKSNFSSTSLSYTSNSLLIVYATGTNQFEKHIVRNCLMLNFGSATVTQCANNPNAETLTFPSHVILPPTIGQESGNSADDDEPATSHPGSSSNNISITQLENVINQCGMFSISSYSTVLDCNDIQNNN